MILLTKYFVYIFGSIKEVDFISDIGGQLGLWAGFSVLSLCEVIELIILICTSGMKREKTSPETTHTPVAEKH